MSKNKAPSIADFLARHLITIVGIASEEEGGQPLREDSVIGSGFILEYRGVWILITAGHVIKSLDAALNKPGCGLTVHLIDSLHQYATQKGSLVMNYSECAREAICTEDRSNDYGWILLRPFTVSGIQTNGIVPVVYENWKNPPDEFDRYYLVGTPGELVEFDLNKIGQLAIRSARGAMIGVTPVQPPPEIDDGSGRFYGKIDLTQPEDEDPLNHIGGMSGCPLLGVKFNGERASYWFIGIQSSWYSERRIIIACPLRPFAEHLRISLDGALDQTAKAGPEQ